MARRPFLIAALAVVLASALALGSGPPNGDVPVYVHEAGHSVERWTHLGYVLLCKLLLPFGQHTVLVLSLVTLVAAVLGVLAVSRSRDDAIGLLVAAAWLPLLPWAEVDLPWLALVIWASILSPVPAGVACAAAVCVSPTALLSVPWLGKREHWLGAVGAVVLLTLISGGEWWTGTRGVLEAPLPRIERTLWEWGGVLPVLAIGWTAAVNKRQYRALWPLLLLLAPPDVPGWGLAAVAAALWVPGRWLPVATGLQLVLSAGLWWERWGEVAHQTHLVESLGVEPGDGVVAPWSVGVRVSLAQTGDPYAFRWISTPPVRDQGSRWCADPPRRVHQLQDGAWIRPVGDPVLCDRPNVVLVVGCTVRKDRLSPQVVPTLSTLPGARFSDLVASAPWTRPAVTALLTGEHPASVGIVEPGPGRNDRVLSPHVVTLAEVLQATGFHTVGATANPNLSPMFGFDQGFDRYHSPAPPWRQGVVKVTGDEILDAVFSEDLEPPLYLQVVLVEPHAPVPTYASGLTALDRVITRLRDELAERGFTDENTVFSFVADHGEGLGDPVHHGPGHGRYLYPSTLEVPWQIAGPGAASGVVGGLASHVDVRSTLLELARVADSTYEGPGRSWAAHVRSRDPAETDRRAAHADTWFQQVHRSAIYTRDTMCFLEDSEWPDLAGRAPHRTGCWSRADPSVDTPAHGPELLEGLEAWQRARREELASHDGERAAVDAETASQLEALGYR